MTIGKTIALPRWTFVVGHNFSSKEQASFNFMAAVTICSNFGAPQIKSATVSIVSPSICHEVIVPDAMSLVFWMLSFKPTFSFSSFLQHFTGGQGRIISLWVEWRHFNSPVKSATISTVSPSIYHEVMGPEAMILVFWMLSFKPTFLLSYFTFIKRQNRQETNLKGIRCKNLQLTWHNQLIWIHQNHFNIYYVMQSYSTYNYTVRIYTHRYIWRFLRRFRTSVLHWLAPYKLSSRWYFHPPFRILNVVKRGELKGIKWQMWWLIYPMNRGGLGKAVMATELIYNTHWPPHWPSNTIINP